MAASPEPPAPPGVVELREDVPLQPGAGGARCGGGPRLALGAFAALSLAVTAALLGQLYYGDYEVAPHGSVSSSAAPCSAAGAAALRAGGRAADAAVAAALCLAVAAPHRTSLDASGALLYWEYRSSRSAPPASAEWGGPAEPAGEPRAPRLLVALAALHARFGARPWADALRPAIGLARAGYAVAGPLAAAAAARGLPGYAAGALRAEPALAAYLESLQRNSSSELCARWDCARAVRWRAAQGRAAGRWRVWAAGAGGERAAGALAGGLVVGDDAAAGVLAELQRQARAGPQPAGVASGLAVVDPRDTYLALVAGLSTPFGSAAPDAARAWAEDAPAVELDAAPALITDDHICGTRYVVGAESGAALAQGGAALLAAGAAGAVRAVEGARLLLLPGGELRAEPGRAAARAPPAGPAAARPEPALTLPAVNFVQQRGDALLSHADSRGGGVASRF